MGWDGMGLCGRRASDKRSEKEMIEEEREFTS